MEITLPSHMEPIINMNIPRIEKGQANIDLVQSVNEQMGLAIVKSKSDPSKTYEVSYLRDDCNCPDNQYRHVTCWHIRAVQAFLDRKNGGERK